MIDLGQGMRVEGASSGALRKALLAEHDQLRGFLNETVDDASARAVGGGELGLLRAQVRHLYVTIEEHLAFEKVALPQALRDVIGWGAVLQEQIEERHAEERAALAEALKALEPETISPVEVARELRALAMRVLSDIESEDAALLNADLDAIATDSSGG